MGKLVGFLCFSKNLDGSRGVDTITTNRLGQYITINPPVLVLH
jgi:hypothetical protein